MTFYVRIQLVIMPNIYIYNIIHVWYMWNSFIGDSKYLQINNDHTKYFSKGNLHNKSEYELNVAHAHWPLHALMYEYYWIYLFVCLLLHINTLQLHFVSPLWVKLHLGQYTSGVPCWLENEPTKQITAVGN